MIKIIDTHHHLWDMSKFSYPWLTNQVDTFLGNYNKICKDYLLKDFLEDAKSINLNKSIHIQAELEHEIDPVKETIWLQSISNNNKNNRKLPNGIVGYANFYSNNIDDILKRHKKNDNFRGIRQMLNFANDKKLCLIESDNVMSDKKWRLGFNNLKKYDLSFDLQIWPWQLIEASKLSKDYPEINIILNHTGLPLGLNKEIKTIWEKGLKEFASSKNTYVKISGLTGMKKNWDYQTVQRFVLDTINIMGVNRCMLGSNYPVDSLSISYKELWNMYYQILLSFSSVERDSIFFKNAEKIYKI